MMKHRVSFLLFTLCFALTSLAQRDSLRVVRINQQVAFPGQIPAGNYSGITYLGEDRYAVVSDKSAEDGFFVFSIRVDSVTGEIKDVHNLGFKSAKVPNRDDEGIAYLPQSNTLLISGEADGNIFEYNMDGSRTIRRAMIPEVYTHMYGNLGFEALSYSAVNHRLWTCNEGPLKIDGEVANSMNGVKNLIRLQSFDDALSPLQQYAYQMDAPLSERPSEKYAMGIASMVALDDGSLLLLEREFFVPATKLGAFVNCKIYQVRPTDKYLCNDKPLNEKSKFLPKRLITEWRTSLSLFNHKIANYEGICVGPRLKDGSQVLLLVADSQNQYYGVLKDWFKSIVVK